MNQNDYGVINVDKNPINSGNSFHTTKGFTHEFETYSDVVQTDQRFREWNFDDATVKFQNPVNKQIPNADPVLARFYKIQPLTVINNLEGGGGGHYNLDWVGKSVTIDPINSGTAFNAFDYNLNEDEYHIIVAPTINVYNTNWNFLEWSDGVTSTTRSNERITSGNKDFTAYYKSWNRTDNTNTYSSNGQNRIVQT
ncbi:MAG: hypothetical protein KKB34_19945, partial [Bacteroidetes bacterium]|nr:hypothetical protein [Bacteroidota bacterium]